ncbi:hypothetical protein [Cohnella candidum]|uniref:Uncharacterized protein n=1 Tax=Cohnella candidum TaxID=2674991 RepID=A0A3G3JWE1_9BACL|nr:hypothetical protein [Cohnella candidum]AYQ72548.1 hypothetical protein EAV92_08195 [Cohnella candidum]
MPDCSFQAYRAIVSEGGRAFAAAMESAGYSVFYAFVEDFRTALREYGDADAEAIGGLLRRARADFPNPGRYSPSWDRVWEEFQAIYEGKNETLSSIPPSERDGEWQVLIDNPLTPLQVACHPGLSFHDAAYLYAYFQIDLKPNEFLKLQKVVNAAVTTGKKEATIFPNY